MKINEFKKSAPTVNEGLSDALLGDYRKAQLKSVFGGGKTATQQLTQDIFIKDFIGDAVTALQNGIKSGLINPKAIKTISSTDAAANSSAVDPTAVDPAAVEPATGEPGAAPTAPTDVRTPLSQQQQRQAQTQTTQNINNYIKGAATAIKNATDKNQKIALTKELINAMADRKGTPEWDNALGTVKQIIKTGGLDPNFAGGALGNLAAGKIMTEAWKIYFINKLVEAVGLTWKELGLTVLKENKKYYIAETKFVKLNNLFENIVEAKKPAPEGESISQYLSGWYSQYMQGVDWAARKPAVDKIIQEVEATYKRDRGKAALKKLAQMSFALSKGSVPAGAKNVAAAPEATTAEPATPETPAAPVASTPPAPETPAPAAASPLNAASVQEHINALKLSDPKGYATIVKQIINDYKKTFAGKTPAPAPAPTAESRRNRYPKL